MLSFVAYPECKSQGNEQFCRSSSPSPWHCQICSVPARTAGTRSQAAADGCGTETSSLGALTALGAEKLLGCFTAALGDRSGSGQRWSAQAGSARSWNCISFCHLAEFRTFTPCAVVSGKESATILVHPAAESSSPNPSSDCAPAEFSLPHFSFFSSGSSALSFPPRCGGCFKVFFAV